MGHTIRAYTLEEEPLAELGFAAHNYVLANYAYRCLHAEQYNFGVGGDGSRVTYTEAEITKARTALAYYACEPYEAIADPNNEEMAETILTVFLGDAMRKPVDESMVEEAINRLRRFLEKLVGHSEVVIEFG